MAHHVRLLKKGCQLQNVSFMIMELRLWNCTGIKIGECCTKNSNTGVGLATSHGYNDMPCHGMTAMIAFPLLQ